MLSTLTLVVARSILLDPNTYSLTPFLSSVRNRVVSMSYFRLKQIWKFHFIQFSVFVIFFASSSQFSHQLLTNVSIVFVEFPFTISSFY